MGSRRKSREAAVQILFQMDASGMGVEKAIQYYWTHLISSTEGRTFADELVRGCAAQLDVIDETIRTVSQHWRIERMARVDRNIIRLGIHELMMLTDVPRKVTLNEAIELAKKFGDEASPSFVNGVLDRIASELGKE